MDGLISLVYCLGGRKLFIGLKWCQDKGSKMASSEGGGWRTREAPRRGRGTTRAVSKIDEDNDKLSVRTLKGKCFRGEERIVDGAGGWGVGALKYK